MPVRQSYGGLLLNTELKKEYLATCHHFQIYQDWVEVKYLETAEHLRDFGKKAGYKIVEVWKGIASGPKQERAERKAPGVGAGPQGRLDPRHRTDPLGPLG